MQQKRVHPNKMSPSSPAMFTYWNYCRCLYSNSAQLFALQASTPSPNLVVYWETNWANPITVLYTACRQADITRALHQPLPDRSFNECLSHRDSFHLLNCKSRRYIKRSTAHWSYDGIYVVFRWGSEILAVRGNSTVAQTFWNFFCPRSYGS